MKCKQCGWINQAGQTTCTWCQAPLDPADVAAQSSATPRIPPPPKPDDAPPQPPYAPQSPGYYLGADGKYYSRMPPPNPRGRGKSPWVVAGWIAFFVFVVPFVLIGATMALCFAALGAGSGGFGGPTSAAGTPIILIVVGGIALVLLVIFSARSGR